MSNLTRRRFMKDTLAAAATITIAGTKSSGRVLGANDTIRIAVAGLNGRGGAHIAAYKGMKNVQITYLIDPDTRTFDKRLKGFEGTKPQTVQDVRKALDDKNLDAISIATCNHWHALMGIWACQAGKDVYVEKPCSHNVFEGRKLVEAAKKYNRIVSHGTQSRGSASWAQKAKDIAEGKLGKLTVSLGTCYKTRRSIGFKKIEPPPSELDFNLWTGPAPKQPYHGNLVHYNWHWFWDFGNGDIGNQGVHQMDIARWMIPGATLPKSVISVGGRFGYKDQGETPNTQLTIMDYGDTLLVFEVRGLCGSGFKTPRNVGNKVFFDTNASAKPQEVFRHAGVKNPTAKRGPGSAIFGNFIECVRSRKTEDLDAHILEGHLSSALCHLANISYRLGTDMPITKKTRAFGDDKVAYEYFERMKDHLKDEGVKLEETTYRVGQRLMIDVEKERIIDNDKANTMLTRPYRPPFIVPEKV
ncbi:MAG: NADH-dependent dehydrogenase [Gemmatales bacterium]|nr:MAG: NADH-dependent dehydrogenase [Gemmatales bacterium]